MVRARFTNSQVLFFVALVFFLTLSSSRFLATAQDLSALISSYPKKSVDYLDAQKGESRQVLIEELFGIIERESFDLRWDAIRVACEIEPWTTGESERDAQFQAVLWTMAADQSSSPIHFAIADCAAANRIDFYFDGAALVDDFIFNAVCEGDTVRFLSKTEVAEQSAVIENVNNDILRATDGLQSKSYFPLRNSLRAAMLQAHLGVSEFRNSPEAGKEHFATAAAKLRQWVDADILTSSRSGWRFHSDLAVLGDIYEALSDDENARSRLRAHAYWPFAIEDQVVSRGIEAMLQSMIPERYVDPIYVGRLLPGAGANKSEECDRWFRTSFDTRSYAEHAISCLDSVGTLDVWADLAAFDNCMAEFVALDWYVGFASMPIGVSNQELTSMQEVIVSGLRTLGERGQEIASEVYMDREDGSFVVRTPSMFSDKDITEVNALLEPSFPWAVYKQQERY